MKLTSTSHPQARESAAAGVDWKPKVRQRIDDVWWDVMCYVWWGRRMKVISAIYPRHWDILTHMPHEYIANAICLLTLRYTYSHISWCNICQSWNSANNFTRNFLNTWKSLTNSLLTGYQCQLLTLGHSSGIIGVKLKCTYLEAPQMFAEQIIHLCRRGGLGALMNAPPRPNLGWAQTLGGSPGSNSTAM